LEQYCCGRYRMRSVILFAALIVVALALPEEGSIKLQFVQFMQKYNKVYAESEVQTRFNNFKTNLARAEQLQAASPSATYGVTKFSDLSAEEFRTTILMQNTIPQDNRVAVPPTTLVAPGAPATWDWRDHSAVTPVKDQGQCGSCWAFSASEAIESAWILKGKATTSTINLSPQQIVDCDTIDGVQGCNGGTTESAYDYIHKAGGQEQIVDYPYTAVNGKCKFDSKYVDASISTYTTIAKDETALSGTLSTTGPLSICLDAENWQTYTGGVMSKMECCIVCQLDHCVQLVGYNSTASTPYWIVRNSWNTDWGIAGYIYLEMNHNTCDLTNDVTWPTIA